MRNTHPSLVEPEDWSPSNLSSLSTTTGLCWSLMKTRYGSVGTNKTEKTFKWVSGQSVNHFKDHSIILHHSPCMCNCQPQPSCLPQIAVSALYFCHISDRQAYTYEETVFRNFSGNKSVKNGYIRWHYLRTVKCDPYRPQNHLLMTSK